MITRPRTALAGAVAGIVALLVTWFCAFHVAFFMHVDHSVLDGFVGLYRPWLNGPTHAIAQLCDPKPYVLLATIPILLALVRRRPRVAVMIGAVVIGANVSSQLLKPLLASPRGAGLPGPIVAPASWPSGHATAVMTLLLCTVIAAPPRWRPRVAAAMTAFAIAVCFSFLTLAWHFPSDVLGGFELASTWVLLGIAGLGWAQRRHPSPAEVSPVPRGARLSIAETLAPMALLILIALVGAAVIALARPGPVVDYATAHKWFVLGAAAIAALGVGLAAAASLALRQS